MPITRRSTHSTRYKTMPRSQTGFLPAVARLSALRFGHRVDQQIRNKAAQAAFFQRRGPSVQPTAFEVGKRVLFRRRNPDGLFERLRIYMWPRRSFSRSFQYVSKRILRLNATPNAVAAGVAAGIFASFFPLGSHFAIAAIVCWLISGNMVAAGLGTFVFGNPLTLPFVVGATWETGKIMLHGHMQSHERPAHLSEMLQTLSISQLWAPVLKPMLCGAVPLGLIFGLLFYGITRYGMTVFREQRRKRLAEKGGLLQQQEDIVLSPPLPTRHRRSGG